METGVVHYEIHERIYDTNTIDRIRLRGYALSEKLVCLEGLPVAYISLSAEELERFNYRKGDTEGLVNQVLGDFGNPDGCIVCRERWRDQNFIPL